jgi:hypothetical protein
MPRRRTGGFRFPVEVIGQPGFGRAWSRFRESVITSSRVSVSPGGVAAAAGGDELGCGGEQPKPQAAGLPQADLAGQGEQGHPGEQLEGDLDDLQQT